MWLEKSLYLIKDNSKWLIKKKKEKETQLLKLEMGMVAS